MWWSWWYFVGCFWGFVFVVMDLFRVFFYLPWVWVWDWDWPCFILLGGVFVSFVLVFEFF